MYVGNVARISFARLRVVVCCNVIGVVISAEGSAGHYFCSMKLPLTKWFMAIDLLTQPKTGYQRWS
ncbi:MAG: hypothetical protein ACJA13_003055 [Paraglaciecola sp.]|jgi:hypothetical protein